MERTSVTRKNLTTTSPKNMRQAKRSSSIQSTKKCSKPTTSQPRKNILWAMDREITHLGKKILSWGTTSQRLLTRAHLFQTPRISKLTLQAYCFRQGCRCGEAAAPSGKREVSGTIWMKKTMTGSSSSKSPRQSKREKNYSSLRSQQEGKLRIIFWRISRTTMRILWRWRSNFSWRVRPKELSSK